MPNKMLIDATHPEETRVVVVRGNRVEEFDFETAQRKQLRGNIYLAKVTRVEPSLQAAFIEYGGNRHGFLAFSEIHPDYYQIPVADRQALIEADERAHREAEEEPENRASRRRSRHRSSRRRGHGERVQSEIVETSSLETPAEGSHEAAHAHAEDGHHDEHDHEHHADDADHHGDTAHHHDDHDDDHGHSHDHEHHHEAHAEDDGHGSAHVAETPVGAAEPIAAIADISEARREAPEDRAREDGAHEDDALEDHAGDEASADEVAAENAAHAGYASEQHAAPPDDGHTAGDGEEPHDDEGDETEEEVVESVGGDDVMEEVPERGFRPRRQYKIQEVIKRRQVMLVQVVKEERGNKGAALTTYLSLAGRYAVLMPNTARGGGISRKITSAQDRSRLKEVVQDLDVPEGMGIILRTAGASRTKPEIKRDFEYLIRMWETVRDMTLSSSAPTLVYEEGSLIKRAIRDLYNKDVEEVIVAGEEAFREAKEFMRLLMPSHAKNVLPYRDVQPVFARVGVEA